MQTKIINKKTSFKNNIYFIFLFTLISSCYAANSHEDNSKKQQNAYLYPTSIPFKNNKDNTKNHPVTLINPVIFSNTDSKGFLDFFNTNGYVVIDNISCKKDRDELVELIDEIANKNIPNSRRLAFMDLYHDKTLANLRQNQTLYDVFTQIYQTKKLWSVFDRVIYWNKSETEMPLAPHVDQNPIKDPNFIYVQAMIALRDMNEDTGTLALVPKSHTWFNTYKQWANEIVGYIEYEDNQPLEFVALRLKEGQIVIWDSRTTHSRFRAEPKANRYAALITYTQAIDNHDLLNTRQTYYKNGLGYNNHLAGLRATANPRYNKSLRKTAEDLTELGKKLYGITSWFDKKDCK